MGSFATANEDVSFASPMINVGNLQDGVQMATLADQGYVLSWSTAQYDGNGGYTYELHQRRYDIAGTAVGQEVTFASSATSSVFPVHKVVALDNGGWINVWQEFTPNPQGPFPGPQTDVYMQQYDAAGNVIASHVLVNDYTTGGQRLPDVTELDDGGYVITWSNYVYENGETATGIYSRRFDANGVAVTGDIRIDAEAPGELGHATLYSETAVAGLHDGGWLVAYTGYNDETVSQELFLQRYDASGNIVGDKFQVNKWTTDFHFCDDPKIAVLKDGGYVLTWTSNEHQDGYWSGIFQQRFDKNGVRIGGTSGPASFSDANGGEEQVNTTTEYDQTYSDVAATADGGWVVVWQSGNYNTSDNSFNIFQQRYDKDGNRVGGETLVNSDLPGDQVKPSVTAFEDGTWVVGWKEVGYTGTAIHQRRFAPDIFGDAADNVLTGTRWSEAIHGGAGADYLQGGLGADKLIGGAGNDLYYVGFDTTDTIVENAFGGLDKVHATSSHTLAANVEDLWLIGTSASHINGTGNASSNYIQGGAGQNILTGLDGDDKLVGGGGADRLYGGNGVDYLNGGLDGDMMAGGAGNDAYIVQSSADTVIEKIAEGTDTVTAYISHTLAANVEKLRLIGTSNLNGAGNGLANWLSGNAGRNSLSGLGGNDRLDGGYGNDRLTGGAGADIFVFSTGYGVDTIRDFGSGADRIDLRDLDGIKDFADLMSRKHLKVSGDNLVISAGADQITLEHVSKADLDAKDFLF